MKGYSMVTSQQRFSSLGLPIAARKWNCNALVLGQMTAFENVKGFRLRPIKFATITRFWSL
jgi:hypothetical protein